MSSGGSARAALVMAERAYALDQVNPRRAATLAEHARVAARAEADRSAEIRAMHALAWAQFQLGDARSITTVRAGIRMAERYGDRRGVGLLRRRLTFSHSLAGHSRAARREIAAALTLLEGPDRAQSEVFRL